VILDFIKEQLHLSSPLGLFLVLAVGVAWLWLRPASRAPRRYLLALVIGYWFLTTPAGASLLVGVLSHGIPRVMTREDARGADTVVVLGGGVATAAVGDEIGGTLTGSSLLRALEAARVFKLIGGRLLIASAGIPRPDLQLRPESEMLRDALVKTGVAPGAIVEESASRTTREQALAVGPMLRAHHVERFVLVTSPTHMRRSLAAFRAAGLNPVPSMAPVRSERLPPPPVVLPNGDSLWLSDDALYECAAWIYYWSRGWVSLR
jgi:uncharacterized SAM-binding protein YcdF (DUF218 family)